jgi:hypothetical protein
MPLATSTALYADNRTRLALVRTNAPAEGMVWRIGAEPQAGWRRAGTRIRTGHPCPQVGSDPLSSWWQPVATGKRTRLAGHRRAASSATGMQDVHGAARSTLLAGSLCYSTPHLIRPRGLSREMAALSMSTRNGVFANRTEDMTRCDENRKSRHSGARRRGEDESY